MAVLFYPRAIYRPLGDLYLTIELSDELDLLLNFKVIGAQDESQQSIDQLLTGQAIDARHRPRFACPQKSEQGARG